MNLPEKITGTYSDFGLKYTLTRGLEYLLLQTQLSSALYWPLASKYYRWKYKRDLREFDLHIDPFYLYYVDPQDLTRFSGRGSDRENLHQIGSVLDGDWDLRDRRPDEIGTTASRLEETLLYQSFESHFIEGCPWEQTEFIQRIFKIVDNGNPAWHHCQTREEVLERCQTFDDLFAELKQNGYKTQRALRPDHPSLSEPFGFLNEQIMEISVDIARDGEPLLVDGRHRLAIAKILELDEVPVMVICRHEQWVKSDTIHPYLREEPQYEVACLN